MEETRKRMRVGAAVKVFVCATIVVTASGGVAEAGSLSGEGLSSCYDGMVFRFASSFDGDEALIQSANGNAAAFTGTNKHVACKESGLLAPPQGFRMGRPAIQYGGGHLGERRAQIVEDSSISRGRVLQFLLQHANERGEDNLPLKGRVQMNMYGNQGVRRVRMSVRMYLHADFNRALSYPRKMEWLTISEWWNNAGWTKETYPFRIAVNVFKDSSVASAQLFFKVHAQTLRPDTQRWEHTVWESVNRKFSVPIDKWITLEYGFDEGDQKTGRFFMAATPDGAARTVIFDIRGYTHHPEDPEPDGLAHWNPIKLYTSRQLIDYVRTQGGALQILWDDLKFVACQKGETPGGQTCSI